MSNNNKFKKHIQLPKSLLTELDSSYGNESDNRVLTFNNNNKKRKFNNKNMTRKERRKQERDDKKRKMNSNRNIPQANKKPARKETSFNTNKGKENFKENKEEEEISIPTDDSLDSEDFDEFDENDLTPEEWKQLRELEGNKDVHSNESTSSSSSSDYDDEEESQSEAEKEVSTKEDLKPSLKQKLAKKVISKKSKKHVSFNKKIMEKLIPARPNYGQPPASSSDEDYDIDEEDEYDENHEEDADDYLDQLALSDSEDDESDGQNKDSLKEGGLSNIETYSSEESEEREMTVEETMAALKAVKEQKKKEKRTKENDSKTRIDYDNDNSGGFEEETEMTVEETMAALKAAKDAKNKSNKKKVEVAKEEEENAFEVYEDPESDEDERNIKYYAKKLNIGKKTKKLKAVDEYDAIGGLLEGLDFFESYGENLGDYGELEIKDSSRDLSSSDSDSFEESDSESSDENDSDSFDMNGSENLHGDIYDDFDENDLTPEEWAQLRELEDSELDGVESEEEEKPKKKNKNKKSSKNQASLYGLDTELDDEDKMAIETLENDMSNVNQQLTKNVKMLFNKLSESNINNIIASLLELFELNPRQACINSIIGRIIIDCDIHEKLLDQFLMDYIGCVYALWKFKGIEFGAYFIQRLVEKIVYNLEIENEDDESTNKNNANLISLLAFSFNFGIITNKLIYNLLDFLADISSETAVELILKSVSIAGVLLRGENPKALNLVINKLLANLQAVEEEKEDDSRLQFLVDTLKDLRLNKINRNLITKTNHLQMKKSITKSLKIDMKTLGDNSSQAIQVSLDDILNIETKGKWWLIGGSYRENMISSGLHKSETELDEDILDKDIEFSDIELHDDFIDELPDYNKLAIQNKMASPLSKAIFVGITSSQDPLDCIMRLDKLDIKKKNYQELVRVLLHVSKLDAKYNPFYELIAIRLSKNMQGLNKFIKFHFWDVIKNFETNNEDDDKETVLDDLYGDFGTKRDSKIIQEARLFGNLIFHKIIPFDVFKHVPILDGLSVEGELFVNSLLYQLLLRIGKDSEKKQTKKSSNSKSLVYDIKIMEEIVFKTIQQENELIILKQLQWYADNKLNISKFVFTNDKVKEKRRVKWSLNAFKELMDQRLKLLE